MRRFLAVAILVTSCGSGVVPMAATTVTGTVIAAPCRPVERPGDPPCPPVAGVTVVIGSARAVTDATGIYRVEVAPGSYDVKVIAGARQVPANPPHVTVSGSAPITLNLTYDSGIR